MSSMPQQSCFKKTSTVKKKEMKSFFILFVYSFWFLIGEYKLHQNRDTVYVAHFGSLVPKIRWSNKLLQNVVA